jgi:hypothetical protein
MAIINSYGQELWVAKCLCLSFTYDQSGYYALILKLIALAAAKVMDANPDATMTESKEFTVAIKQVWNQGMFECGREILELILSEPFKKIFQKNRDAVIQNFIGLMFGMIAKKDVRHYADLYSAQLAILDHAVNSVHPFIASFSPPVQKSTWNCAVRLIAHTASISSELNRFDVITSARMMCYQSYHPTVATSEFYPNFAKLYTDLEAFENDETKYYLLSNLLYYQLIKESDVEFLEVSELTGLLHRFFFKSFPTTRIGEEVLLQCENRLVSLIENFSESYPKIEHFNSSEWSVLRRTTNPFNYYKRLACSPLIWNVGKICECIDKQRHHIPPQQMIQIIATLLVTLDQDQLYLEENAKTLSGCQEIIDHYFTWLIKACGSATYVALVKNIANHFITFSFKSVTQCIPAKLDINRINMLVVELGGHAQLIASFGYLNVFQDRVSDYWKAARRLVDYVQTLCDQHKVTSGAGIMISLILLDTEPMQGLGVDINTSEDYSYIQRVTIDDFIQRCIQNHNAEAGLELVTTLGWPEKFANHSLWQAMICMLKSAKEIENPAKRVPLNKHIIATAINLKNLK